MRAVSRKCHVLNTPPWRGLSDVPHRRLNMSQSRWRSHGISFQSQLLRLNYLSMFIFYLAHLTRTVWECRLCKKFVECAESARDKLWLSLFEWVSSGGRLYKKSHSFSSMFYHTLLLFPYGFVWYACYNGKVHIVSSMYVSNYKEFSQNTCLQVMEFTITFINILLKIVFFDTIFFFLMNTWGFRSIYDNKQQKKLSAILFLFSHSI